MDAANINSNLSLDGVRCKLSRKEFSVPHKQYKPTPVPIEIYVTSFSTISNVDWMKVWCGKNKFIIVQVTSEYAY